MYEQGIFALQCISPAASEVEDIRNMNIPFVCNTSYPGCNPFTLRNMFMKFHTHNKLDMMMCRKQESYLARFPFLKLQTTHFIPTLDTLTKVVIMTIWLSQNFA